VGLLVNFSGQTLLEGYRRIVNRYVDSASLRLRAKRPAVTGDSADVDGFGPFFAPSRALSPRPPREIHPPGRSTRIT
jgi:hypothetical protein